MKEILTKIPSPYSDLLISVFNKYQYLIRHSGIYKVTKKIRKKYDNLSLEDLKKIQQKRLKEFIEYSKKNSKHYSSVLKNISIENVADLKDAPFLKKEDIVNSLNKIATISSRKGIESYTGGTTGASLKVIYKNEDMQERFAYLDYFRELYGYKLGKKTAWFSGKSLLSKKDISRNKFYKDDVINKIRFFSTFNITKSTANAYYEALNSFEPEYLVGFPSSVLRICKFCEMNNLKFKKTAKYFFPAAEKVTDEHREVILRVMGCEIKDQYASSEGAPFIFECPHGKMHIDITSGVFEVLDESGNDADMGELVVTSFSTRGTPLIRYRVGDKVSISNEKECKCGSNFPICKEIDGRKDDFLISKTNGEINLGNISNATKGVEGIINFQLTQNTLDEINVKVAATNNFTSAQQIKFVDALKQRFGEDMHLNLVVVDEIPLEESGKFRIIKNFIK